MAKEMRSKRIEGDQVFFDFVCGCGADGELVISSLDGFKSFACPEGCGNTFVPYKSGPWWQLRCVVERVYLTQAEGRE